VIGLGFFAASAIILYWALWFLAPDFIQARHPGAPDYEIYVHFEQSFILADAWLALAAVIGAIGLWNLRDWGFLFMLLAGGAAIFLGLMDLLYDMQHGMFVPLTGEAAIELVIVALLLCLGPLMVGLLWKQRELFICRSL
jgi:hypothetical protein